MIGSTSLGLLSDRFYGKRGPVAFGSVIIANFLIYFITFKNETVSEVTFFILMFFLGVFVSGLNNLV